MTKYDWDKRFKRKISILPSVEQDKAIEYFSEIFDDKIERGMSEEDIIAEFGDPEKAGDKILLETNLADEAGRNVAPDKYSARYYADKVDAKIDKVKAKIVEKSNKVNDKIARKFGKDSVEYNECVKYSQTSSEYNGGSQAERASAPQRVIVREKKLCVRNILILILLSPFIFALASIAFSLFLVAWSVVLAFGVAGISLVIVGIYSIFVAISTLSLGAPIFLMHFAIVFACIGLGLLFTILCGKLSKGSVYLSKKLFGFVGSLIVTKKEVIYEK